MEDQFQGRVPVNKIIPFSAVDGPGNRTAVFVQGCNFNCRYCHNPETRSLCRSCGECVEKCPKQALYIENGKVLEDAYRKTDLPLFCEGKRGCGHHPHGLPDNTALLAFIRENML